MIVRRLYQPPDGFGPYLVEEHAPPGSADELAGELWRSEGTVGVVVVHADETEQVDALYLHEAIDQARIPEAWRWRGLPLVKVDLVIREPRGVKPITRGPPPPLPPGIKYDTATHCGCCHRAKEGAYRASEVDRTPGGRLAEGRCPACGARLEGMSARDMQQLYFAYLRG